MQQELLVPPELPPPELPEPVSQQEPLEPVSQQEPPEPVSQQELLAPARRASRQRAALLERTKVQQLENQTGLTGF